VVVVAAVRSVMVVEALITFSETVPRRRPVEEVEALLTFVATTAMRWGTCQGTVPLKPKRNPSFIGGQCHLRYHDHYGLPTYNAVM